MNSSDLYFIPTRKKKKNIKEIPSTNIFLNVPIKEVDPKRNQDITMRITETKRLVNKLRKDITTIDGGKEVASKVNQLIRRQRLPTPVQHMLKNWGLRFFGEHGIVTKKVPYLKNEYKLEAYRRFKNFQKLNTYVSGIRNSVLSTTEYMKKLSYIKELSEKQRLFIEKNFDLNKITLDGISNVDLKKLRNTFKLEMNDNPNIDIETLDNDMESTTKLPLTNNESISGSSTKLKFTKISNKKLQFKEILEENDNSKKYSLEKKKLILDKSTRDKIRSRNLSMPDLSSTQLSNQQQVPIFNFNNHFNSTILKGGESQDFKFPVLSKLGNNLSNFNTFNELKLNKTSTFFKTNRSITKINLRSNSTISNLFINNEYTKHDMLLPTHSIKNNNKILHSSFFTTQKNWLNTQYNQMNDNFEKIEKGFFNKLSNYKSHKDITRKPKTELDDDQEILSDRIGAQKRKKVHYALMKVGNVINGVDSTKAAMIKIIDSIHKMNDGTALSVVDNMLEKYNDNARDAGLENRREKLHKDMKIIENRFHKSSIAEGNFKIRKINYNIERTRNRITEIIKDKPKHK